MNFKTIAKLRSHPSINASVRLEPAKFEAAVKGSCECHVGRISAWVGDIGIRLAIPFQRPRRRLPLVGTIGGFRLGVNPFDIRVTGMGLDVTGTVHGLTAAGEAHVSCETDIEAEGKLPVKVGRIHVDLDEEENGG
ncbi:MAG: hypothetical protein ABSG65_00625 [Bryobacteraceae bacterium]